MPIDKIRPAAYDVFVARLIVRQLLRARGVEVPWRPSRSLVQISYSDRRQRRLLRRNSCFYACTLVSRWCRTSWAHLLQFGSSVVSLAHSSWLLLIAALSVTREIDFRHGIEMVRSTTRRRCTIEGVRTRLVRSSKMAHKHARSRDAPLLVERSSSSAEMSRRSLPH